MMDHDGYMAEQCAAEGLAADMDVWITFDPLTSKEPFLEWLDGHQPSQIYREDGIRWISVDSPYQTDDQESDPVSMQMAWEQLQNSGRPINFKTISELALAHGILFGKWLFHVDTGIKADHLWSIIARAVVDGQLGPSAKISPNCTMNDNYKHVICVYNENFTDKESVLKLENALRMVGIKCPMSYKPDVFTYLGIYRQNQWNIRPTIYSSVYELMSGISKLSEHYE